MLGRAFNPLLVNEVPVVKGRLPVSEHLKQDIFGHHLQGSSDSVVARNKNVTGSVLIEFILAELEQANIRAGALLGVEARLDLCNRLHESEVRSQYVCDPL